MRSVVIRFVLSLTLLTLSPFLFAHDITISGTQTFSSLDGSSSDHDGLSNGVFTVNDGNLTVNGIVNCNDVSSTNACAMSFAVSGNMTVNTGGALYAENRSGDGNGGAITLTVGGNLALNGTAIVSGASTTTGTSDGGSIVANVGGGVTLASGTTLDVGAPNGQAGSITVAAGGLIAANGNVYSGASRTLLATKLNGAALSGGNGNQSGGSISLSSTTFVEPAITVGATANIVSQGEKFGAGPITIDGCRVEIRGLVAALSRRDQPARVAIRSGKGILVDGSDLGGAGTRMGRVRGDSLEDGASNNFVDLFASDAVQVLGPSSLGGTLFAVSAVPTIKANKDTAGTIRVISTGGGVSSTGRAFVAGVDDKSTRGGTISIAAAGSVNLDGSTIVAIGDHSNPTKTAGGHIIARSYGGNVLWRNGTGDVRPVGSLANVPVGDQGTIVLTACGTVDTTGSTFPTNGVATSMLPETHTGVCSPAAPSLPAGEPPLITCNTPPVANDTNATTNEDTTVTIFLSGSDADGDSLTFSIVSGPSNGSLGAIIPTGPTTATVDYSPNLNYNGSDSFVYRANDGNGGIDDATASISITPVNDPPSFLAGPTVNVFEDSGPQTIPNWVTSISPGPSDESAQAVTFNVTNNNNALFSVQPSVSSSGTLTFTPATNAFGSATITIVAQDNGGIANGGNDTSAAQMSTINVNGVNDEPSFTAGPNQAVNEDAGPQTVVGWATGISAGPNEGSQTVSFVTSNNNNALFSVQPSVSSSGTLTYTPAANANGIATVQIFAQDDGGIANGGDDTSPSQFFTITVNPVNDAPSFTSGGDVTVLEDSGAYSAAWATGISAGPANESGQTVSFNTSNDNNALFSVQPSVSSTGVLTFTPAANAFGSATITVTLSDNGGIANGGVDTSAPQMFTITVDAVNDEPSFTPGGNVTVNEDSGAYSAGWATGISAGPNESGQTLTFNVSNDNNGLFSSQPSISSTGVLSFTPAANAFGTATVSVFLMDDGGVANGGDNTSPTVTFTITVDSVNDEPSFTPGGNVSVLEDSGSYSASWATAISAGPANESGQSVTFNVSNNNNGLFSVQPAIAPDGTLTFTVAANAFGSATVSVFLTDDGGVANGGDDTSPTVMFTITVDPVNDAPSFTPGGDVSVNEDSGVYSAAWASAISAGPANESGQTLTFNVSNSNNALFSVQPSISSTGVLTFTPAANAVGSATVTVSLSDNGGIANGGVDTSAAVMFTITVNPVNDAPNAAPDSWDTIGNTRLEVNSSASAAPPTVFTTGSVLANDSDIDGPGPLTASLVGGSVTPGAIVSMASDGTFTYIPPAGFSGNDTFQYSVTDGVTPATGTVTIHVLSRVWYVNNSGAAGDGRSHNSFNTLAAAQTASLAGDTIFVYNGDNTTSGQNAGIVLKANQRLIGQGVALTVPVSVNGGPNPTPLLPAGTKARITNTAGNGVTATLGGSVEIAGVEITGATAHGIALANNSAATIRVSNVQSSGDDGINGSSVTNLTMTTVAVLGSGNAATDNGVEINGLFGTSSITFSEVSGSFGSNVQIANSGGTLSLATSNNTIRNTSSAAGNFGFAVLASGTASMSATISNTTFNGNRTIAARGDAGDMSTLSFSVTNSQFTGGTVGNPQGNQGVEVTAALMADVSYAIDNNVITGLANTGINIFGSNTSVMNGTVTGNSVTNAGAGQSGFGIRVINNGQAAVGTRIDNNTISNVGLDYGIFADSFGALVVPPSGAGVLKIAVTNNNVSVLSGALDAIRVSARNNNSVCARINGNTTNAGGTGFFGIFVRQANTATFRLEGLAAGSQTAATTQTFVQSQNPAAASVGATAATSFTGVASGFCPIP